MTATTGQNADYARELNLLKEVFAPSVEDMVPETDMASKKIPFQTASKTGKKYLQPVTISRSGGFTFWNDGSIADLNKPLAPEELVAEIQGSEFVNRTALSYKFLNTASEALGDGKSASNRRAFVNATKDQFSKLAKGSSYARECTLLYGGGSAPTSAWTGLAKVSAITGSSGTSLVATIDASEWATAIWAGSRGLEFDIHDNAGTKRNSAGTGVTTIYQLTSVDIANKKLTFTSHATNVSNVVANDIISFAGSRAKDMLGIVHACQQTGSLWGINVTTYELWKPQTIAIGGALTYEKLQGFMAQLAGIGFYGDVDVLLNPSTYQDVCNDQTALVNHSSGKTSGSITIGFDDVSFKSQAGTVHIHSHQYMKGGLFVALPRDYVARIGSTDITHTMPGFGKMFRELENQAGVEMRHYYDQAFFSKHASYLGLGTGIVNSTP